MAHRSRNHIAAMPASSPAGISLFLVATLGPITVFATLMRVFAG